MGFEIVNTALQIFGWIVDVKVHVSYSSLQ